MIFIEICLFLFSKRSVLSFTFFFVHVMMSVSYSPVSSVIFQCFPGLWSEKPRSVVAEKFRVTLGYRPEYIKDVGDSDALVFINNLDFTLQHKRCIET